MSNEPIYVCNRCGLTMSSFICPTCGSKNIDTENGYDEYCDCGQARFGTLKNIILKAEWFEKIENGSKTSEFREFKPYWITRLKKQPFKYIEFSLGYGGRKMTFEIISISVTRNKNDLNLEKVFEIKLGEKI
ncbi:MAG: hypothetical protein ACK5N8_06605 [Alphaproteobacteria bacterium]